MSTFNPIDQLQQVIASMGQGNQNKATPGLPGLSASEQAFYNVYLGSHPVTKYFNPAPGGMIRDREMESFRGVQDHTVDSAQAFGLFYQMSDAERTALVKSMKDKGLLGPGDGLDAAEKVWGSAVDMAGKMFTIGGKKVTPFQALDFLADASGSRRKPTTRTSVSRSVNTVDRMSADGMVDQTFTSLMGRAASDKEKAVYRSALNAYLSANPSVTRTTETTDVNGNTTSSSSSSGGVTQAGIEEQMRKKAQSDPDYGAFQASTTLFSALEGLMGMGH